MRAVRDIVAMPHQAPSSLRPHAPPAAPAIPAGAAETEGAADERPALQIIAEAAALASMPLVPGAMIAHLAPPPSKATAQDIDDDEDDEEEDGGGGGGGGMPAAVTLTAREVEMLQVPLPSPIHHRLSEPY